MLTATYRQTLLEEIEKLDTQDQQRVLDFARSLAQIRPHGIPGKALLRFFDSLPPADPEDLRLMTNAIEADTENIDIDEW